MTHTPGLHRVRDQRALADEKTCRLNKAAPDMLDALEGAKWLIDWYVAKPERYEEYQDVVKAIRKARGEDA